MSADSSDAEPGDGDEGADNRPPTARIAAVSPVAEGDTLQLDATASDDPDGDELTFSWELEDGRAFDGPVVEIPTDDDLSVVATVTVDDGRGGTDTAEVLLLASNVAPSVAVDTVAVGDGDAVPPSTGSDAHPVEVTVGETIAVAASFVDPGLGDTHVARIVWGDGSVDATDLAAGERAVDGSHAFDDPGDVTVTVEVCDDDGGCGDRSFPVRVRAVVPPPEDDDAPGGDEPPAEEPDAESDDGPVGEAPPSEPDEQPDAAVDDGPVAETPTSETDDTPQGSTPSLPTPPGSEGLPAADVEVLGSRQERGERIAVPADTVELSRTGGPLRSLVTLGVLLLLFGGRSCGSGVSHREAAELPGRRDRSRRSACSPHPSAPRYSAVRRNRASSSGLPCPVFSDRPRVRPTDSTATAQACCSWERSWTSTRRPRSPWRTIRW